MKTFVTALSIIVVWAIPLFAETTRDLCVQSGMTVKNLTLIDLKYKKEGGICTTLKRAYQFIMKPDESVEIFSDLICEKPYCRTPYSYKDMKDSDTDGNCRVRILPDCTFSDM